MSSIPASAMISASPSFWQVMPRAPAATCIFASTGLLWVLICGRLATPAASQAAWIRAMVRATLCTPLAAQIAREYGTPCGVIDMDGVERNSARDQDDCDAAGVANRPHIKTHKSPLLAQMQVKAGARGITCQKIGEAEIMADAGIDDILISYNLIGEEKMARLGAVQTKANVTVAADNSTVISGLPKAAEISGRPLSVVIEDRK